MLKDLNALALEAKKRCEDYDKGEFTFSQSFKDRFKELNPDFDIVFSSYTSILTTSSGKIIIIPNQWFVIGSFFCEFINALKDYKSSFIELGISSEKTTLIKNQNQIDEETNNLVERIFTSIVERDFF